MNRLHKPADALSRRVFVRAALAASAAVSLPAVAQAPAGGARWLVGYPAGGGADFVTRTVAQAMAPLLGTAIEVVNMPGKGATIAAGEAAKAPADGLHLFTADNGILVYNRELFKTLPYDPDKAFSSVGFMARTALFIVASPRAPFKTIDELLKLPADQQAKLAYASPGAGSPHHLAMELFKQQTGLKAAHKPYRGTGLAMPDVIEGKVPLLVVDAAGGMQAMKAGQVVPLLSLSGFSVPQFPKVPRPRDVGQPSINAFASVGLVVPRATPAEAKARLSKALLTTLNRRDVAATLLDAGWESVAGDALMMDAYMAAERGIWPKLIRELKLQVDG